MSKKKYNTGKYYDQWTKNYLDTGYGNVIQAHRPENVNDLLLYIAKNANIKPGMKILDAGCGICGPAVFFAKNFDVQISAITISDNQKEIANEYIAKENQQNKIEIIKGDFHKLTDYYTDESFDLVIMLESFGHSHSPKQVFNGISRVLKKDGHLYIKDYFRKEFTGDRKRRTAMRNIVKNLNNAYSYNLPDLNESIKLLRLLDLELVYIQRNKLPLSNDNSVKEFETKHNIDIFNNGFHYQVLEPLEIYFKKLSDIDAEIK